MCTCEFTSDADRHEYKQSLICQLPGTKSVQRKAMTCLTRSERVGVVCPTLAYIKESVFISEKESEVDHVVCGRATVDNVLTSLMSENTLTHQFYFYFWNSELQMQLSSFVHLYCRDQRK